jgi:hypothetical protein
MTMQRFVPATPTQVERIAAYYEQRGELEQAGDMWARAEQPDKALRLYLAVRAPGWARGSRDPCIAKQACLVALRHFIQACASAAYITPACMLRVKRPVECRWHKARRRTPASQVGGVAAANKAIALVEARGGDAVLAERVLAFIDGGAGTSGVAGAGGGGGGGGSLEEGPREELRFRLHVALGRPAEAGRAALELARIEQVGPRGRARARGGVLGAFHTGGSFQAPSEILALLEKHAADPDHLPWMP